MKEQTKRLILVSILVLGFFIMLIGNAKAEDLVKEPITKLTTYDSIKSYDTKTQTLTLINKTDLSKNVATLKLNTPLINKVGYGGIFKVAEFEINSYVDVESALKQIEFYNLNKNMEKIERSYEYKVKNYQNVIIDDYEEVCIDNKDIKNITKICSYEIIGNHIEQKEVWLPLEKIDFLKDDVKTIGIFTYVYKGDKVEWIPTYYGVEIKEWASWVASLNSNLVLYYKFDDNNVPIKDEINNLNITTKGGTPNFTATGLIRNGLEFNSNGDNVSNNTFATGVLNFSTTKDFTYNWWINKTGTQSDSRIIRSYQNDLGFLCNIEDTRTFFCWVNNGTWMYKAVRDYNYISNNTFIMYTFIRNNSGTNWYFYKNGNLLNVSTVDLITANSTRFILGDSRTDRYTKAIYDEIGVWNRALTGEEIQELYSSGEGMSYGEITTFNPTITLNSPINFSNYSVSTIPFNFTVYHYNIGSGIDSISLYIDGELSETNTTDMANGTTYYISKALSSGYHNWSVNATTLNSTTGSSELRTFNITIYSPTITLNTPINYYNTTNPTIDFNVSVYDDFKVQNVSLYIDGVYNRTNTMVCNYPDTCEYYFNDITFTEDEHYWSILAYDNDSNPTQSGDRYFTIDSTPPVINVTMPPTNNYKFWTNYTDGIYNYYPYSSYFINWTTYDLSLNTCWFENISFSLVRTNLTIPCNTNATIVYPVNTGNTLRFYANDSMGNNASVTRTSIYNDIRIDRSGHSYINYTTEGVPRTFWLSARIGVGAELENVNFVLDGVKYPLSTSGSNFSKSIIIPEVTTTKATTYYWEFDFGEGFFNSTIYNITIGNILLSPICNSTYPYYVFNITLRDEKTQREINGTIETAISIYPLANSSINIYNWTSTQNTNRTYLCSNLPFNSTDIYKAEGTIKYYSDLGTITNYTAMNEYYNFLNFTLNNNSQFNNITLYDINTSEGTEFQLTFKDSSYRDRENVLIYVYRQYLPENTFKVVEVPKTDSNGQTIVHLVRNDVIYNLIAVDSTGSILGILNNVNAFCNDYTIGDCKIEFQGTTSETELENYIDDLGFSYTLTFNETSSTIDLEFLSDTNEDKNIRLVVISSAIVTNRTLCNTSLDAITGTLSCDVSSIINSSSSINVKIYLDEQEVINDYLSLDSSDWNVSGIIFFGFLFIILVGIMFVESKEGMVIGVIVGLIILVALGVVKGKVIGLTSGILWLIVAGIIILIKLNKENR